MVLVIASAKDEPKVPILMVTADEVEQEAMNCGYELIYKEPWFQQTTVIADCEDVNEVAKRLDGIKVSPNTAIYFSFNETMDQFIVLNWHQEVELNTTDVLIAPQKVGTYVYMVTAYWGENEATYVIKVIVE